MKRKVKKLTKRMIQQDYRKQYKNEKLIKEWYENYISFYTIVPPPETIKSEFLEGELQEIKRIFTKPKEQKQIFEFVKNVILNI